MIQQHLKFIDIEDDLVIAYQIEGNANNDPWEKIFVAFNGSENVQSVDLPKGNWTVVVEDEIINEKGIRKVNNDKISLIIDRI